ncbi:hypothetical protein Q604_UNBC03378G0001, partial [human gut metagenome]
MLGHSAATWGTRALKTGRVTTATLT